MNVKRLIEFLQKEIDDEEVLFLAEDGKKYRLQSKPPRHAGPAPFTDENGKPYKKSVVLVWIKEHK